MVTIHGLHHHVWATGWQEAPEHSAPLRNMKTTDVHWNVSADLSHLHRQHSAVVHWDEGSRWNYRRGWRQNNTPTGLEDIYISVYSSIICRDSAVWGSWEVEPADVGRDVV